MFGANAPGNSERDDPGQRAVDAPAEPGKLSNYKKHVDLSARGIDGFRWHVPCVAKFHGGLYESIRPNEKDVRTCWINEPLDRAAKLMWESDCGSAPVLDQNGRVVGMITDRDVCMAAYTQAQLLGRIPVSQAMSAELYSCKPEEDLDKVEKRMRFHQVRRLPVVDDEGLLRGILSLADIAQRAAKDAKGKAGTRQVSFAEVGESYAAVTTPHRHELVTVAS